MRGCLPLKLSCSAAGRSETGVLLRPLAACPFDGTAGGPPLNSGAFFLDGDEQREENGMVFLSILVFLLISKHFPLSLTIRALEMVM